MLSGDRARWLCDVTTTVYTPVRKRKVLVITLLLLLLLLKFVWMLQKMTIYWTLPIASRGYYYYCYQHPLGIPRTGASVATYSILRRANQNDCNKFARSFVCFNWSVERSFRFARYAFVVVVDIITIGSLVKQKGGTRTHPSHSHALSFIHSFGK